MSGTITLTTWSIKTIKNTNNFSIFNWIPWSSHGITEVKLIHETTPVGGKKIKTYKNLFF
ncbi:MAG: hypothetical protein LN560_03860 [Rickettsia endosymbiont of Sceptobius lativentris]|nr:hypothetical protein [Rickettsia endosymbiont of Sceptobius lativentris]